MTRRTFAWAAAGLFGFVFLGLATMAQAADKNATGTWKWSFNRQNGETIEIVLKLKQEGDKLTGTMTGPGGREDQIKDGTVKGNDIAFKTEREFNGNTFTINYSGKLEGDTIKGKSEFTGRDGEKRSRDWEAKRAAD